MRVDTANISDIHKPVAPEHSFQVRPVLSRLRCFFFDAQAVDFLLTSDAWDEAEDRALGAQQALVAAAGHGHHQVSRGSRPMPGKALA
jgi:hypothetical protein